MIEKALPLEGVIRITKDIRELRNQFYYRNYRYKEIVKDAKEIEVALDWALERRRTYLDGLITYCKHKKKDLFNYLANGSELEGKLVVDGLRKWDKMMEEIEKEKVLSLRPQRNNRGITEEMIQKAKEYPIKNLLMNPVKQDLTNCIAHDDKNPSMNIKNNWAYCHACGFRGDSISVYMRLNGVDFNSAVKNLN